MPKPRVHKKTLISAIILTFVNNKDISHPRGKEISQGLGKIISQASSE
jgi:hypothetical protein